MTIDRTHLYWFSLCRLRAELFCWADIFWEQDSSAEKG